MSSRERTALLGIEQLKGYISINCFHASGQYVLSNGETTDYYIDTRSLACLPQTRSHLVKALSYLAQESIKGKKVRYPISYIGMETGGISLALVTAINDGTLFGYLRKTVKDHGLMNIMEHESVTVSGILFEDVINTGITIKNALEQAKLFKCYSIICIANRNPNLKTINEIPIYSLLSYEEILKIREYEMKKYSGEMNDIPRENIFKQV